MNYKKIYDSIITKARSENRVKGGDTYYEAHHIIPKCLGGEGHSSQWKTHPNIILLTAREHFLCHWLLHEIYPNNQKILYSFKMMSDVKNNKHNRYTPSSRVINYARCEYSKIKKNKPLSKNHKEKISFSNAKEKNGFFGKTHSQEQVNKWKISRKGKPSLKRIPYIDTRNGVIHTHIKAAAEYYKVNIYQINKLIKDKILIKK